MDAPKVEIVIVGDGPMHRREVSDFVAAQEFFWTFEQGYLDRVGVCWGMPVFRLRWPR